MLLVPGVAGQVGVMLAAGAAGWWLFGRGRAVAPEPAIGAPDGLHVPLRRRTGGVPLFTFAAFLGASMQVWPGGWLGAAVCLVAIFVPSFLLVADALPFWEPLRRNPHAQAALAGVNAAVVGLLLAALYDPVWTSAIHGGADFGLALAAFVALAFWRAPPWAVVLACGAGGALLAAWL